MTNEVSVKNLDFSVDFKKSEITVAHREQFETAIKAYAKKYEDWAVSAETLQDAKDIRAEMNKANKLMDEKRKEIKKQINKPLTEFEDWIKAQKEEIQRVIDPIDKGIKELEAMEQEERSKKLMAEIAEISPNYGVEVDEITINPSWANKGNFTTKGKLNKKALNEICGEMKAVKAEKDQLEANKTLIANYAEAVGLEPESWIVQIESGSTPQELMKQIDLAIKAKNERLEQEKKRKEYEEAIEELQNNQVEIGDKVVDEETGEIVNTVDLPFENTEEDPFPIYTRPSIETVTYRLSAPHHLILLGKQNLLGLGIKIEEIDS
ncbi:DUF1351 domain-containing protein [Enterococcus dongliensis]|uniref:DUF1351 domain-containing protein n=1 Tax=Enterococcus dongliensis TaxID=2559925 RepID=UPI00288CFFB8|nr:DUF1351 domain-containing protein [Enterococcus dongliensis]MDT2640425.1 DUF1351 domain-containing protein [Enterococcus dongliensis]